MIRLVGASLITTLPSSPDFCTRESYLQSKDMQLQMKKDDRRCHMIRTRPGYEMLTKMKYKGGQDG